jgi:hypothetical protein
MALADVIGALRSKRAKTIEARGEDVVQPHHEAGYTSAIVFRRINLISGWRPMAYD